MDVFPVDGIGQSDKPFDEVAKLRRKYDYLTANTHEGSSTVSLLGKRVLKAVMPKEDIYQIAQQVDDIARATPLAESKEVAQIAWPFGSSERMPSSIIFDTCLYDFEGEQFDGPRDYDLCLTRWYGDYMTPPPRTSACLTTWTPAGSSPYDWWRRLECCLRRKAMPNSRAVPQKPRTR